MTGILDKGYERKLVAVEDWSPPQPPKRRCPCGTILRHSNTDDHCEVCKRKLERGLLIGRSRIE